MKQVTIKDIAREAGVSIASVSRALNGMDGISEKKRSRILRVCERLSYTPNGLARSLVKRRTQTIGIIMPDIMSPFYSELMVKASDAAHKRGYQVLLCNSFRELRAERDYLKLLAEHQVEGILIFPIGPRSTESMSEFIHNVPMVALNELTGQCGIPYVCADEEQAGRIAAEYLISRGCRNLLFVGFKPERLAHRYRAASDATANGIVKACRENGIRIPEDFSLIGFDNITEELPYIELTTVAVSHEEQMETAVELLGMVEEGTPVWGGGQGFREAGTAAGGTPFL
ncbi:LacI family transcriptional regulator [Enterocloster clostridioformis]|uniref:LacI family DNA-binding transcriptional regulator n=1 Tax=Enterocloster clostridioformis TaxID=1531 RepID=UPI00156E9F16|nr:LacI family DNA-binding transcriptional regulator [Enterocloster clostridioformis]NSD57085.1 LacI family transcriptional regulator [Enterocloster clostridioformis]NSJ11103.1 LacI family transcriptional regulator [Enterocloster clostridioformis]NSJ19992.1 LacI family transcriptional regulator [Enterocloster clostridioformis]NSJ31822.1 LacI family transcriptional regulator [Enterocloster clostridioformis]NSJ60305.1 LacI family transcriptional regulator [Enterocloster clostridioformis]